MGLDLMTPDHTTLSRRSSTLEVAPLAKTHDGPIHLVVDATGLKMVGDGEWLAHKHETSNRRRSWRKLHLGVDEDGFIVASELTDSSVDDASVGVTMLDQMEAAISNAGRIAGRARRPFMRPALSDRESSTGRLYWAGAHQGVDGRGVARWLRGR